MSRQFYVLERLAQPGIWVLVYHSVYASLTHAKRALETAKEYHPKEVMRITVVYCDD